MIREHLALGNESLLFSELADPWSENHMSVMQPNTATNICPNNTPPV